ncbi:MAG: hypothetical protein H7315_16545, partial [Herminiimonas sp.]|nr:hypothetical protein [Herminiimonas sp.]
LGIVLILCLIAIGWLIWRFNALRKNQMQASWEELFPEAGRSTALEENSAFDNTTFNTTELVTALVVDPIELDALSEAERARSAEAAALAHDAAKVPAKAPRRVSAIGPAKVSEPAPFFDAVAEVPRVSTPFGYSHSGSAPFILSNRTDNARPRFEAPPLPPPSLMETESLKAEEISDVMELVEAWTALHEPAKVLELLEPFDHVARPESPLPWLCLLDVYSTLNDQEKYDAILHRITTLFNVKLTPWEDRAENRHVRTLADFPHVVDQILTLWDSDEISPYLQSLLLDNRDGARDGFDLPVYRDIARLNTLALEPNRPRKLDQLKHVKAYAVLFAEPGMMLAPAELAPQPQPARESVTAAPPKPLLRERPRYITTSYQRELAVQESATAATPVAARESVAASLFLNEPELKKPSFFAARPVSTTKTRKSVTLKAAQDSKPEQVLAALELIDIPGTTVGTPVTINNSEDMSPMTIKLHLAIAYQDIGDIEGACLLLDEVISDGTPEQSTQARLLLSALG